MIPFPLSNSASGGLLKFITSRLFLPRLLPVIQQMLTREKKKKNNGAMLSPYLTPTLCDISTIGFPSFSTLVKSIYMSSTAEQNLGGAPDCYSTLMGSL